MPATEQFVISRIRCVNASGYISVTFGSDHSHTFVKHLTLDSQQFLSLNINVKLTITFIQHCLSTNVSFRLRGYE